jgi:hypothetical protein
VQVKKRAAVLYFTTLRGRLCCQRHKVIEAALVTYRVSAHVDCLLMLAGMLARAG